MAAPLRGTRGAAVSPRGWGRPGCLAGAAGGRRAVLSHGPVNSFFPGRDRVGAGGGGGGQSTAAVRSGVTGRIELLIAGRC